MASARPPARPRSVLRILAWVLPFAVVLVAIAIGQLFFRCLDCGGFPTHPSITFENPEPVAEGFACRVAHVSVSAPASNYRVVLRVNESGGTPVGLSADMTFTVDGRAYAVTWIDSRGEAQLTAADELRVTRPGGLLPGTDYTLLVFWSDDGSVIQTVTYHTP